MTVLLNLNWRYWDDAKASDVVGWTNPVADKAEPLWAYQRIAADAASYQADGFAGVILPPSCEGAAGIFSDGYDKRDDYSLANTAFGDAEMLRQCVAVLHANGLAVYGDLVLHQYDGGRAGVYATKRFPKTATCFAASTTPGGVEADTVPDEEGNFAFGDLAAYQHAEPAGYMHDGAIAATQWLTATTGFDGYRVDEAKGLHAAVVYDILHAPGLSHLFAFFEYFDGSPGPVSNYVNGYMRRRGPVLDFATKFNLGDICNNQGRVWMGRLSHIGYCASDPDMALVFVESADTDTSIGQQTIWNKALAYAFALTIPARAVAVYWRDWADEPRCYGLKTILRNLVWIHNHLAGGDFVPRLDTDPQVFVHERTGWGNHRGCLCAFNNDPNNERTVTVQTRHPPNTRLHEYTGHYDTDIWTDAEGRATFTLAKNINGLGYLVWAVWDDDTDELPPPLPTVQTLFGAADLPNTKPLGPGNNVVGRIYCAAGTTITANLTPPTPAAIYFIAPDGTSVAAPSTRLPVDGWYQVLVILPAEAGSTDYALRLAYTAPRHAG